MKRRAAFVLAAGIASGCGEPAAEDRSRLAAGQSVILYHPKDASIFVIGPTCGGKEVDHAYFNVGTRATVVEDGESGGLGASREVRVNVLVDPPCSTKLSRGNLRPAK